MTKSKLEKVLEHMVNNDINVAVELLHEHFVESAAQIYADLVEEDELAEEELELDENDEEDLDEAFDDSDRSGRFKDDISSLEDEVEAEEYFSEEGDDEDEAMDDLEGEMDLDLDAEMGDE